eukprot:5640822-Pyramimonas_sp.AAC.1
MLKAAKKMYRDFCDRQRAGEPGFKGLMMSDATQRIICAMSGKIGHLAETCRRPFRSKEDRVASEQTGKSDAQNIFLHFVEDEDDFNAIA